MIPNNAFIILVSVDLDGGGALVVLLVELDGIVRGCGA